MRWSQRHPVSVRPGRVGALMVLDYALVVVTRTSVSCVRGFRGAHCEFVRSSAFFFNDTCRILQCRIVYVRESTGVIAIICSILSVESGCEFQFRFLVMRSTMI